MAQQWLHRSPALLGGLGSSFRRAPGSVRRDPVPRYRIPLLQCGSAQRSPSPRRPPRFTSSYGQSARGYLPSIASAGFVSGVDVPLRRLSRQLRALPQRSRRAGYVDAAAAAGCTTPQPAGAFLPWRALAWPGVASEARRRRRDGALLVMDLLQCAEAGASQGPAGGHGVAGLSLADSPDLLLRQRAWRRVLPGDGCLQSLVMPGKAPASPTLSLAYTSSRQACTFSSCWRVHSSM